MGKCWRAGWRHGCEWSPNRTSRFGPPASGGAGTKMARYTGFGVSRRNCTSERSKALQAFMLLMTVSRSS